MTLLTDGELAQALLKAANGESPNIKPEHQRLFAVSANRGMLLDAAERISLLSSQLKAKDEALRAAFIAGWERARGSFRDCPAEIYAEDYVRALKAIPKK